MDSPRLTLLCKIQALVHIIHQKEFIAIDWFDDNGIRDEFLENSNKSNPKLGRISGKFE